MTDEERARELLEALGWHKPHHLSDDAKTVLPFLAAVRAETVERCARVAESSFAGHGGSGIESPTAVRIAARIRELKGTPRPGTSRIKSSSLGACPSVDAATVHSARARVLRLAECATRCACAAETETIRRMTMTTDAPTLTLEELDGRLLRAEGFHGANTMLSNEELIVLLALARRAVAAESALAAQREQYQELLFEVCHKHEGESRHETARRYIREREMPQNNPPASSGARTEGGGK